MPGVHAGPVMLGLLMNKGITVKTGQTHMLYSMKRLLERIEKGEIDPSFIITHRPTLEEGPKPYKTFRDKQDGCIKVVMRCNG